LKRQALLFVAVLSVLIVLVVACAGCSDLPPDTFGPHGGDGAGTQISTPTPNWVEEATPIRTPAPMVTLTPVPIQSEPCYTPPVYTEIYAKDMYLLYNVTALNYDLATPPMHIDLDIKPEMYLNKKKVTSSYGSKKLITITESYPLPYADLIVTIIDRKTGNVVKEHDFPQFIEEHETHTLTMREPGCYQVEITGNNVHVGVSISVPEANILDGNQPIAEC
jgi:hypothetical protein